MSPSENENMIEIKPNALYTRADLIELLKPLGIDADAFVARIRPRKVFRAVWVGNDILRALDEAPALGKKPQAPSSPPPRKQDKRNRQTARPTSAIDAYLEKLKGGVS